MKPRLVPYLLGGLILISPAISLALMFALASLGGGCRVHEGFPEPCRIVGLDFSNILYYLGLWGAWGFFFSWFVAGVFTLPWLAIHLCLVISEAIRKRAISEAKAKVPVEALDVKQAVDSVPHRRPPTGRWRVPRPRSSLQWIGVLAAIPFAMMFVKIIVIQPLAGCTTIVACLDSPYSAVRSFILLYKHSGLLWFVCLVWLPIALFQPFDVKQAVESVHHRRPPTGRWRVPLPRSSLQWIGVLAAIPFAMIFVNVIVLQPLAGCTTDVACLDSPYIAVRSFILLYKHSGLLWFVCLVWLPIALFQRWRARRSA